MVNAALALEADLFGGDHNMTGAFMPVAESCRAVVDRARDVRIDREAVAAFAMKVPVENSIAWKYSGSYHFTGREAETLRYVLCMGAINYGSGYAADIRRSVSNSTYYTMASHLKNAATRDPSVLSSGRLSQLTTADVSNIFGQVGNDNPHAVDLMQEFTKSLNELGNWLITHYDDHLDAVVDDAMSSSSMLISLLRMDRFRDEACYDGHKVYFWKRAQLLIADLARVGREFGWWETQGLDQLTIFADNAVAHVMRQLGLMTYSQQLAGRVDSGGYLHPSEPAEVEIRAASIVIGELLRNHLSVDRQWPTILEIDHFLWDISHRPEFNRSDMRRHMCRTIAY